MPLSPAVAAWLIQQGHDAVHAADVGLSHASDSAILQRAHTDGRVVITADLDFPRLFAMTHLTGPGLILLREGNYTEHESLALITRVLQTIPADDLPRSIVVVDHIRIRKTPLPL